MGVEHIVCDNGFSCFSGNCCDTVLFVAGKAAARPSFAFQLCVLRVDRFAGTGGFTFHFSGYVAGRDTDRKPARQNAWAGREKRQRIHCFYGVFSGGCFVRI